MVELAIRFGGQANSGEPRAARPRMAPIVKRMIAFIQSIGAWYRVKHYRIGQKPAFMSFLHCGGLFGSKAQRQFHRTRVSSLWQELGCSIEGNYRKLVNQNP